MKIVKNKFGKVFVLSEPGDVVTIVRNWDGSFKEVMVEFDLDKMVAGAPSLVLEDVILLTGSILQDRDFQEDVQSAIKEAEKL